MEKPNSDSQGVKERPPWFARLDTSACQERFDEVESFAVQQGRHEQFMGKIKQLCFGDKQDADLYWGGPISDVRVLLHSDFAPKSFIFSRDVVRDEGGKWEHTTQGGLIFHGPHDGGGDGSAPTFSVNMSPQDGWSIHT